VVYATIKQIHAIAAAIVVVLFVLRGIWMLADSPMLERKWVRIVPHVNDTILLAAAIWLATLTGLAPFVIAKIVGLVLYIVLGTIALKRGRTKPVRTAAFVGALAVLAYIFAVAVTKRPLPLL
jgi:uncharacterized membrane protein SirB2